MRWCWRCVASNASARPLALVEILSREAMLPAVGQGALAIECRAADETVRQLPGSARGRNPRRGGTWNRVGSRVATPGRPRFRARLIPRGLRSEPPASLANPSAHPVPRGHLTLVDLRTAQPIKSA